MVQKTLSKKGGLVMAKWAPTQIEDGLAGLDQGWKVREATREWGGQGKARWALGHGGRGP